MDYAIYNELYPHQVRFRQSIRDRLLLSTMLDRGQIISPTGSGKTVNVRLAIEDQLVINPQSFICVAAPRKALKRQIFEKIVYGDKNIGLPRLQDIHAVDVSMFSSEQARFKRYNAACRLIDDKPTTDPNELAERMKEAHINNRAFLTVGTHHSKKRLSGALRILKEKYGIEREFDLDIMDEAHHLTSKEFGSVLDDEVFYSKKRLFFTATQKNSKPGIRGRGMNNTDLFGEVIDQESHASLVAAGVLLPIKIHMIIVDPKTILKKYEFSRSNYESAILLASVKACYEKQKEINGNAKILVFCPSASGRDAKSTRKTGKSVLGVHQLVEHLTLEMPGAPIYGITSEKMTKNGVEWKQDRTKFIKEYESNDNAIMCHFDILGEGTDIPSLTSALFLREMGIIKTVQGAGRIVRLLIEDIKALKKKKIKVGDPKGWSKAFGNVTVPVVIGTDWEAISNQIIDVCSNLMYYGWDPNVELVDDGDLGSKDKEKDGPKPPRKKKKSQFDLLFQRLQNETDALMKAAHHRFLELELRDEEDEKNALIESWKDEVRENGIDLIKAMRK